MLNPVVAKGSWRDHSALSVLYGLSVIWSCLDGPASLQQAIWETFGLCGVQCMAVADSVVVRHWASCDQRLTAHCHNHIYIPLFQL